MEFSKKNFTHFLHSKNMAFTKNLCIGFFLWQSLSLGMLRSDLMLETHPCSTFSPFCCWKQVEINTIASGFGWMGPASGLIHRSVDFSGGTGTPKPGFWVTVEKWVVH